MLFYIYQLFIFVLFSFLYTYSKDKYLSFVFKLFCFLILFIPSAIRYNIGTDYISYVNIFNEFQSTGYFDHEIGWGIINNFVSENNLDVQWIFVISSFITYIFLLNVNKKNSLVVFFLYYSYLYLPSFNIIRQSISISLFLFSCICLQNNQKIRGFIFVIISLLFHNSAFLYIPLYFFMCYIPISKKLTIFIAICIIMLCFSLNVINIFMRFSFLQKLGFEHYLMLERYNHNAKLNSGLGVLLNFIYTFILYFCCDEKKCTKIEFRSTSWLFIAIILANSLYIQISIFYRVYVMMFVSYIIMFKIAFKKTNNGYIKVFRLFCLLYVIIFVFLIGLCNNQNEVIPYNTCFN